MLARPIRIAWAAFAVAFAGYAVAGAALLTALGARHHATDPVTAIDDALARVAAHTWVLAPLFRAAPALITVVHALAAVLALAVIFRPRVGLIARVGAGAALVVAGASGWQFWLAVLRGAPVIDQPDLVAQCTLFLLLTAAVLTLALAVHEPDRRHRRRPSES